MAKGSNIVHLYFKKEGKEGKTLLKINPIHLTGVEIIVPEKGEPEMNEIDVMADYDTVFVQDGFQTCSPLEFNLYWNGLV